MALGFLKKLTKTPKFLRFALGNSWLDEAGAAGGFVTGGPGGAAAGSAAGTLVANKAQGNGWKPGHALSSGLKAGSAALGAQSLGLKGGSLGARGGAQVATSGASATASGVRIPHGVITTKVAPYAARGRSLGSVGARAGDLGSRALGYLKDNPDMAFRALEAVGDAHGASVEDGQMRRNNRIEDEDIARRLAREARQREIVEEMQQAYATGDPSNPYRNRNLRRGV
jgi:hypothetical protein